jgi:hypothetical protein
VSKENGFVPLRRGLWEHIRDGRMSHLEALAFIYICSQADTRTGVWKGSAGALVTEIGLNPRTARDVLERMERGDYIRRFATQGVRHCYPILVHKFPVTQGEHNGKVLDALNSSKENGLLSLHFISCEVHVNVHDKVHGEVHASQRRSKNRNIRQEKTPAAKTAPPADPRFQAFVTYAHKTFEEKHGAKPSWLGKDFQQLRVLLRANASLTPTELERRWRAYLDSSELFIAKQGDSLTYFATHCDTFASGPIMQWRGKANGKDINDAVATTMHGAFNSGITH